MKIENMLMKQKKSVIEIPRGETFLYGNALYMRLYAAGHSSKSVDVVRTKTYCANVEDGTIILLDDKTRVVPVEATVEATVSVGGSYGQEIG